MSSLKTHPRKATKFLSRKQQWRIACGAGARRSRPLPPNEPETAKTGRGTEGGLSEQVQLRTKGQENLGLDSPDGSKAAPRYSQPELSPQRTNSTCSVSSSGGGGDVKEKRRVSFDSIVEVVLVPTRHELKSKELLEDGAGEAGHKSDNDDGIWWTMSDCFGFRKAYRRQLVASGVKCTSLLCPTSIVFQIGAEDDDEDVRDEEKTSYEVRQVRHSSSNKISSDTLKGRRRRRKNVAKSNPPVSPWDFWGSSATSSFLNDI